MGAHVHDGIDGLPAEPEIERDMGMARRAGEIVIVGFARGRIAALRLNRDDRPATCDGRELKCTVATARIILRRAPGLREIILQGLRQARERRAVVGDAPGQLLLQQCFAERLNRRNIEAGPPQIGQQRLDRRQRIEPDRMRDLMRTARVVREHERHPLPGGRRLGEAPPGSNARGDGLDALLIGPVRQMRKLQIGIALRGRFEAHHAREQAAVDLRKHHVHREIAGRQAAQRFRPVLAPCR